MLVGRTRAPWGAGVLRMQLIGHRRRTTIRATYVHALRPKRYEDLITGFQELFLAVAVELV